MVTLDEDGYVVHKPGIYIYDANDPFDPNWPPHIPFELRLALVAKRQERYPRPTAPQSTASRPEDPPVVEPVKPQSFTPTQQGVNGHTFLIPDELLRPWEHD
jgi:hypothetical protein